LIVCYSLHIFIAGLLARVLKVCCIIVRYCIVWNIFSTKGNYQTTPSLLRVLSLTNYLRSRKSNFSVKCHNLSIFGFIGVLFSLRIFWTSDRETISLREIDIKIERKQQKKKYKKYGRRVEMRGEKIKEVNQLHTLDF
jgi:hypothetical protein